MSTKMVYHQGTGTYMAWNECQFVEVPEDVEDVNEWMERKINPPEKEMILCRATITFYVTAYEDDEDNEREDDTTKEQLAEDYLGEIAENWEDLEVR